MKKDFLGFKWGWCWKGSQRFIGPVFTPFDPPTCVIIVKENWCDGG